MGTQPQSSRVVSFGLFEVDLETRELRKRGIRLKLHEQTFQLLTALLDRPGEIVTREELRQRLWPDDTFVDFDHGINTAVKKLREVLADSADNPRFVETIARRGYRFLAPVDRAVATPAELAPTVQEITEKSGREAPPAVTTEQRSREILAWTFGCYALDCPWGSRRDSPPPT